MYPNTELLAGEAADVYAEYIMWNAGDVPILIWQPAIVLTSGLGRVDLGKGTAQLERGQGDKMVSEQSFPVVLGRGEVCIWRQFTGDVAPLRPEMSEIHAVEREKAEEFLQKQEGNRRFLFEVVYFSKPPAAVTTSDIHRQYVGFAYQSSYSDGDDGEEAK